MNKKDQFEHHLTHEIRATNADVDDVSDGLPGEALPLTGNDLVAELLHVVEDRVDLRGDVLPVDDDWERTVLKFYPRNEPTILGIKDRY